jgi:hypothetical protein
VAGEDAGNTAAIVEAYEANPNVGDGFAAQLCDDLPSLLHHLIAVKLAANYIEEKERRNACR